MASQRRPRGTRVDPVAPGYVIERASKDTLAAIAQRSGVSPSEFIERMVAHVETELDTRGIPTWWPQQEGLPIDAA